MKYGCLFALVLSALISSLLTRWVRDIAVVRGWVRAPSSSRHVHRIPVPRLGGVAIFLATTCVVGAAFFFPRIFGAPGDLHMREAGILGPAALIFALGLYDDARPLGARFKFLVQTFAGILLYLEGFGVSQMDLFFGTHSLRHFIALPLTVFWVLLITNAFNLIDGLDGLAGGSALFSTLVVFVVSLYLSNSMVSFLAIVLAGAILGFLPFNFSPATVFMGDSGSLFIGFLLGALGLAGSQKAPTMVAVAIPVVSFGLPILDVLLSVSRRFLRGKPLFEGDREHIHHKLLASGLSQREVVLILYAVTAGFGLLSLSLLHGQEFLAVVLAVAASGICLGVQRLGYCEFSELQRVARRTVEQRKIIANNLIIRHAGESLRTCQDYAALREILRETLLPLGFDGFEFVFPTDTSPSELLLAGKHDHDEAFPQFDTRGIAPEAYWTLKLLLNKTSGDPCGSLWLYRNYCDKPLLLDINLLTSEFQAALARAVERSLIVADLSQQELQPEPLAVSVRAGSF
jgi:UDP-GlcNAc:undecaprenyl-phosphate GlcNAc-1-phosphate transferase